MGYKKILVAVELNSDEDERLVTKAKMMAQLDSEAELFILNVVEYTDSYSSIAGISSDIDKVVLDYTSRAMDKLCAKFNISSANCSVKIGSAKNIILEQAESMKYDLIVVGSHGKNGFRFLLGSTADRILNAAPCDILSVRVE